MERLTILRIRTFGDPALRAHAQPIERVTRMHRKLAVDMLETMRAAPGVGLAAPQVGVLERVLVWEVEDDHGTVINPVLVELSEAMLTAEEGCLSLPGLTYPVARHASVVVEGLDQRGRPLRMEAEDYLARVLQHEVDHLDGVLFIDRLPEELRRDARRKLTRQALGFEMAEQTEESL
ncbi:MAG TPA: peptide deformylase [Actinomycetota bacterium]|nr:peptide deformylase [Actinomycetota bacterium]